MPKKKRSTEVKSKLVLALVILLSSLGMLFVAKYTGYAPTGPEVVNIISNTTAPARSPLTINVSGGYIYTVLINTTSQNSRWKAFVGNVSGKISLDNANNYTIYDWTLTFTGGEIYATRAPVTINWTTINCTWGVVLNETNRTIEGLENYKMNHTSPDDNISATFSVRNHSSFFIGTIQFQANYCYAIYTYVNDTTQSSRFQEIILYDGTNTTNGNVVYASILESDRQGYDNRYYDFQIIVPEFGYTGFSSSTLYSIYVEID